MTTMVLLGVLVAVVAGATAALAADTWRARRPFGPARLQRVVVNTKDGDGFTGVLYRDTRRALILTSATRHEHGEELPVDGQVIVRHADVAWLQAPKGEL